MITSPTSEFSAIIFSTPASSCSCVLAMLSTSASQTEDTQLTHWPA